MHAHCFFKVVNPTLSRAAILAKLIQFRRQIIDFVGGGAKVGGQAPVLVLKPPYLIDDAFLEVVMLPEIGVQTANLLANIA